MCLMNIFGHVKLGLATGKCLSVTLVSDAYLCDVWQLSCVTIWQLSCDFRLTLSLIYCLLSTEEVTRAVTRHCVE